MEQDRMELHSGLGGDLFGAQDTFMFGCPYLGTIEDTDTSLSFPSPANHCFRAKSPAAVDLSHQETYCLTDMHPGCHIFHQSAAAAPVEDKRKKVARSDRRAGRASIYALPLILLLIFLAAILWWPAPGTAFQEAIAFGAQLQSENNSATVNDVEAHSSSDNLTTSGVDGSANEGSQPAEDSQSLADNTNDQQQGSAQDALSEAEALESNSEAAAENNQAEITDDNSADGAQPDQESRSTSAESAAELEEASISTADPEPIEETTQETIPTTGDEETVAIEEAITEVDVEESIASAAESEEGVAESVEGLEVTNASEEVSNLTLLVSGLPVIDTLLTQQSTAVDQSAAAGTSAGLVAFIGPDSDTPLALRNENSNERALFVRESPTLTAKLLTIVNRRQQATILGRDSSGTWLEVRLENGVEGWVNVNASQAAVDVTTLPITGDTVEPSAQASITSNSSTLPIIRSAAVSAGALNLRSGPGVAYEPVTILNKGEIVGLLGRRGSGVWVKIRLDSGIEGWVNASLLSPIS